MNCIFKNPPKLHERIILFRKGKLVPLMPTYSDTGFYDFPVPDVSGYTEKFSNKYDLGRFARQGDTWLPIPVV